MKKKHYTDVEVNEVSDYGSKKTTIRWLITKEDDGAPNFTMRRFEIEPGGNIGLHSHPQEHEIYVLEGSGTVFTPDEEIIAQKNDVLYVPPNEQHGYKNKGKDVFVFLCVIPYLE